MKNPRNRSNNSSSHRRHGSSSSSAASGLCRLAGALAVTALMAHPGYSQFGGGLFDGPPPEAAPVPAWQQFKLDPKTRVTLDFRNASVDAVLQYLSKASGITIVKDPALTGGISLASPQPQTLAQAFAQLTAVLNLKNYDLVKQDGLLIIKSRGNANQRGGNRFGNGNVPDLSALMTQPGGSDRYVLQIYPIKFANASEVARVINDVFPTPATPQPNIAQFQQLQNALQGGGFPGFGRGGNGNNNGGNNNNGAGGFGRGGRGGFSGFGGFGRGGRGGGSGAAAGSGVNTGIVHASSDDYSNSVIVNATTRDQLQVADVIQQLDKQADEPQQSRIFTLKYASASGLAPVIQNVLQSNAPRGRGGATTTSTRPGGFPFGGFGRGGSQQTGVGQVVSDDRSNSLVVTATVDNLDVVGKVIEKLDTPVAYADSTFVFPLQNARADVVAQIMNQSFSRNGGGTTNLLGNRTITNSGSVSANNSVQRSNTNRLSSSSRSVAMGAAGTRAVGRGAGLTDAGDAADAIGEAVDPLVVGQFQGGGARQGGGTGSTRQGQTTTAVTGTDSSGQVVNIRDMAGDVTAIPDVNTNSVLLVSSPQNKPMLESVLKQLDRIPAQVMVETLVVEATLDDTQKLGIEWNFTGTGIFGNATGTGTQQFALRPSTGQTSTSTGPGGFQYTLTAPQYGAFLQAVQTNQKFQVLSAPRIFTTNNATAQINISQSLPYVLSQQTDTLGNILYNYSFLDVGIVLTVTPRITANGYVTMDVTQTANDFVGYTSFNAPIVNQREADTTVSVQDGATVCLGGIIENTTTKTVNKIPILGDIPLIGNLFRSNSTEKAKTELLVFLTPHVVRNSQEADQLRQDTIKQLDQSTQSRIPESLRKPQVLPPTSTEPGKAIQTGPTPAPGMPVIVLPAPGQQQPTPEPAQPGPETPTPTPDQPAPTPTPETPAPAPTPEAK